MAEVLTAIAVLLAIAVFMAGLVWLAARVRRRGTAGAAIAGAMAAYDEGMHGTAYDAFVEVQAEDDRATAVDASAGE